MKKALTIALTLISGIIINGFIGIGLSFFTWDMHVFGMLLIWLAALAAVTALLNLASWKLSGIVNDVAFILCAQFPSVIFMAVLLIYYHDSVQNVLPLATSTAAAAAAFTVSELTYNKGRLKNGGAITFRARRTIMKKLWQLFCSRLAARLPF